MEFHHTQMPLSTKSEAELNETLFDSIPVPLLLVDAYGFVVKANSAERRLLGFESEEMQGKSLWEFIANEEKQLSEARFKDILNGMEMTCSYRRRFKTKADDYLICELTFQLVKRGSDDGPFVLLASVDVTTQVAEACRRGELTRWMEASFRSLPEATMILDTLGCIRYLNRAAEQLLGWSETEASGSIAEDLIPWSNILSSDGACPNYEFRQAVSRRWSGSATVIAKGGIARRLQITTEPVVDFNGLVLGISSCMRAI